MPRARRPAPIASHLWRWFILAGTGCGALLAIAGVWLLMGWPKPAWSSDIRKLGTNQVDTAIDLYSKSVRDDTILRGQVKDPVTRGLVDQRIKESEDKLNAARSRKIELSK